MGKRRIPDKTFLFGAQSDPIIFGWHFNFMRISRIVCHHHVYIVNQQRSDRKWRDVLREHEKTPSKTLPFIPKIMYIIYSYIVYTYPNHLASRMTRNRRWMSVNARMMAWRRKFRCCRSHRTLIRLRYLISSTSAMQIGLRSRAFTDGKMRMDHIEKSI